MAKKLVYLVYFTCTCFVLRSIHSIDRLDVSFCHYGPAGNTAPILRLSHLSFVIVHDISVRGRWATTHVVSRQGLVQYELRVYIGSGHALSDLWWTLLQVRPWLSARACVDQQTRRLGRRHSYVGPSCFTQRCQRFLGRSTAECRSGRHLLSYDYSVHRLINKFRR